MKWAAIDPLGGPMSSAMKVQMLHQQEQRWQKQQQRQKQPARAGKAGPSRVLSICAAAGHRDCDHPALQIAPIILILRVHAESGCSNRLAAEIGCENRYLP